MRPKRILSVWETPGPIEGPVHARVVESPEPRQTRRSVRRLLIDESGGHRTDLSEFVEPTSDECLGLQTGEFAELIKDPGFHPPGCLSWISMSPARGLRDDVVDEPVFKILTGGQCQ